MTQTTSTSATPGDLSRRFLFEDADIRGETVHIDRALSDILAAHQYAPGVRRLMGEFLAAAALLSTTLKFEGTLVLQARSSGQIPLLMAECNNQLHLRAIARGAQEATSEHFEQLLTNGQLAITIDPVKGQRYQGIVPLVGNSLAHSLDAYFEQSEQLHTRFWLASDGTQAAGMLLQQLPAQLEPDPAVREQQWEHVCALAETVQPAELLDMAAERMLYRLFHEDPVRIFTARPLEFRCTCSRERTLNALSSIGASEVEDILKEQGAVTMDCEFCNQRYVFQREDLGELLGGSMATDDPPTLH
jgi:molecular chaperone Hsp33